jgi:hypothetical protein
VEVSVAETYELQDCMVVGTTLRLTIDEAIRAGIIEVPMMKALDGR